MPNDGITLHMALRRGGSSETPAVGPQAEVETRFPLIFSPRPGPAPAVGRNHWHKQVSK